MQTLVGRLLKQDLNLQDSHADVQIIDRDLAQAGFTPARKAQISLLEHSRGHVLAIELASIRVPFTEVRVSQHLAASVEPTLYAYCSA